jgi:hypothetical protein
MRSQTSWLLPLIFTLMSIVIFALLFARFKAALPIAESIETSSRDNRKPRIVRIREILPNTTRDQLENKLNDLDYDSVDQKQDHRNVLQLSIVPRDKRSACATVTFRHVPTCLSSGRRFQDSSGFSYDFDFLGITPIYDGCLSSSDGVE